MAEEFLYYYTSKLDAKENVHCGWIEPTSNPVACLGSGVYLTALDTNHGQETIRSNVWDGHSNEDYEVYFEIQMPSSSVSMPNETKRNVQVHYGNLYLSNYNWNLKSWDGQFLATQYFWVQSEGSAREVYREAMGLYSLVNDIVMAHSSIDDDEIHFVWKSSAGWYLYMSSEGQWSLNKLAGDRYGNLIQRADEEFLPSPCPTTPWEYWWNGTWFRDDVSLKVLPFYE